MFVNRRKGEKLLTKREFDKMNEMNFKELPL